MRKRTLAAIIIVAGIATIALLVVIKPWYHRREVRVYFQNAQGLREGAAVRIAGVDVGTVTRVRVRPELRAAEVVMSLHTAYKLNIPKDATVSLSTEGVLGPTFALIEIIGTSGPPLENGGVLKSREVGRSTLDQLVDHVTDMIKVVKQKPCDSPAKSDGALPASTASQSR